MCPDGFVYNLEVDEHNTYFANGVLVHNSHHAVAQSYRRIYDHFKNVPHLGVTATPDRLDEEALGQIYGSVAMVYEIADAIKDGWLVSVRARTVVVHDLDLSDVSTTGGDLNQGELAEQLERERSTHEMAASITKECDDRRAIVFAVTVRQARRMAEILNDYKPDCARWVSGETPTEDRRQTLAAHKRGECQYMVNVGVLTEGYDDPGVGMIVVARPTKSRALFAQMLGRGTRALPGVVDGPETAELRKRAIAESEKQDLLCIAEGTPVLTDIGLVSIENVTTDVRVWDGVEFVEHSGAILHGQMEVITYAGLTATPDHKVWTTEGWKTLGECAAEQVAICVGEIGGQAIREADRCYRRGFENQRSRSLADRVQMRRSIGEGIQQRDVCSGRMQDVRPTATDSFVASEQVPICLSEMYKSKVSNVSPLRSKRNQVQILVSNRNGRMGSEESWTCAKPANRQDQQRRSLSSRESSLGHTITEPKEYAQTKAVWDILNAGPRNRFVASGLIVSNCLDFTGNCGRHKLITPADVLGGAFPDEDRAAVSLAMQAGIVDVDDELERARAARKNQGSKADQALYLSSKNRIVALASYMLKPEDLFDVEFTPGRERTWLMGKAPTDPQLDALERAGFKRADCERMSRTECSRLIGEIILRRQQGLCTLKQARCLSQRGVKNAGRLTFEQAREHLDRLYGSRV